ncbi:MAG: LacI family transcriptional regulator [Anaerolineaceae bacterium]|nr:MAG: LacI family transcriptional regulator [Anaerolineaceae bacterium]
MAEGKEAKKVNLKLISEMTGFSTATISNALNRKKGVNKQTAAKIFNIAKEVGYINEDEISKIRLIVLRKSGLIIDDTPFFPLMMDGIEKECSTHGFEILFNLLDQQEDDYVEQVNWMLNDTTSAIILLGTELSDDDVEIFKKASCPLVTLDFWCNDMSFNGLTINNMDSSRMAVEYLIGKGHREIGYLRGSFRIKAFSERALGYRTALHNAEIPVKSEYRITLPTTVDGAYTKMLQYLTSNNAILPTAYFADNDLIAMGAIRALQKMGYRIPDDISIIGFDDLPFSEIASPPLTTVRVPKQEMGRLAVRKLIDMIDEPRSAKVRMQVCTSFIERESVKNLTQ